MEILYIVPYTPTRIRVRPHNLIRYLALQGHKITVATLWEDQRDCQTLDELRSQGIDVIAAPLRRIQRSVNSLRALATGIPIQAAYCWQPALARMVQRALQRQDYDVVHIEHIRGAAYGLWLKRQQCLISKSRTGNIPILWDSVDCISYLFEQAMQHGQSPLRQAVARLELGRTRRYEGWLAGQFSRVVITSRADKHALELLSQHPSPICVIPNGVDLEYFRPDETLRQARTVIFSGKMSYHANIAAALYLVTQVMPEVWLQCTDVRLVIAGSAPPPEILGLARRFPSRVQVTGYLADMRVPIQQASVAACALPYGAGIQNKVLEAMACATPVVASPKAVGALEIEPGSDCFVADSPKEFAHAIIRLLADTQLRRQVGSAGRAYVERHHDWRDVAKLLQESYRQTLQGPTVASPKMKYTT